MTKTYTDSRGYRHHIASFEGRRNKLKSLLLLALRTEPSSKSLSARQLEELTGHGFYSIITSIARWSHWDNRYISRKGRARLYRYNLALYGTEFLEILHRVAPLKEIEYLNIVTTNRAKRESERIIIPTTESSPTDKLSDAEIKAICQEVLNKLRNQ